MTFMPWSSDIAVGLGEVDDQHRWLVDCINRLHTELSGDAPDKASIGATLEGLMDYTMNHFIMEEALFERHAYPDAVAHKAQHDQFTGTILQALTAFEGGQNVSHGVLEFLKTWLLQHIMRSDKNYVPFLKAQGLN